MNSEEKRIWGIHTKDDTLFLKDNIIAIGWHRMGNLSLIPSNRDAFKDKYIQVYPDAKKGSIATGAGMLYRFCYEIQIGDYVIFPSKRVCANKKNKMVKTFTSHGFLARCAI